MEETKTITFRADDYDIKLINSILEKFNNSDEFKRFKFTRTDVIKCALVEYSKFVDKLLN